MTETKEKKHKGPDRPLPDHEYAAYYAVYYAILGKKARDTSRWGTWQRVLRKQHKAFITDTFASTSDWRVVPDEKLLTRLLRCQPFPAKRRPNVCDIPAICPWCYASSVAKLYHQVRDVVRAPENAGKWLVATRQRVLVPIPQIPAETPAEQRKEAFREFSLSLFRSATRLRTQENRSDERHRRITAAVRYVDVSPIWIEPKLEKGQKRKRVRGSEPEEAEEGRVDKENYEIISRALLITTDPSPKHVVAKLVLRIDDSLTDKTLADRVGWTMQQSAAFYKCSLGERNTLMFAKRVTNHCTYKTYGTLRGTNGQTHTAAAE